VDALMLREAKMWKATALVIPRYDVNRYASVRNADQRRERLIRQAWKDARAIEDIATVHHKIDRAVERRL
jgi:hypothetical protein